MLAILFEKHQASVACWFLSLQPKIECLPYT